MENKIKDCEFVISRKKVLSPVVGSDWACEMVLNPAIIKDPNSKGFICCFVQPDRGWTKQCRENTPYPIYLGYGFSDDNGETWT